MERESTVYMMCACVCPGTAGDRQNIPCPGEDKDQLGKVESLAKKLLRRVTQDGMDRAELQLGYSWAISWKRCRVRVLRVRLEHLGFLLDPFMAHCELCGRKPRPEGPEVDPTLATRDKDTWLCSFCQNVIVVLF